ncbi:uncharacterized protein LOC144635590 [Oculina patagonica]
MEGKHGRSGARSGRTIRSRFAQSKGNRSEGLLIHSSFHTFSSKGGQNEEEVVTYSLGKQNRWLLPEVIKANSAGFDDREEVVLVERYTNVGNKKRGRPDCISVFNSKNGTIRKPKRKLAQAKDLLGDIEEVKARYEVAYPHPSGSRLKSTKRPAGHLGKRKKNFFTRSIVEEDDDLSEIEYLDSEEKEDFSEQTTDSSSRLDLDVLINLSSKASPGSHAGEMSTSKNMKCTQHDQSQLEGKCIYVENDEEMQEKHLEFLAQIKAGDSLLDARDLQIKNNQSSQSKEQKRRRRARNVANKSSNESVPPSKTCPFPIEPVHRDVCEGVIIKLRRQEITPAALAEQWSHMYKEGASYPRVFALNVMPLVSLSNSKEVFIVLRVFEDHAKHNSGESKALVSMVVCNDKNNTEKTPADFISQIKRRSAEQEIWALEDIANVAICFLEGHLNNANGKVDYKEPRKPRLSLDLFTNLFGWKSRTFSSQAAKQQVKECLAEVNGITTASAAAVSDGMQMILECEICFQEIMMHQDSDVAASYLSLTACGHNYCNDCWRAHLKTQIEHGHTDLRCPGYECNSAVDDVTLMSLVPSLYGRHLTKRLDTSLEMDPEWKWCPADQCKLVVKATTPQDRSVARDVNGVSSVQPVPVACVCGTMWCFKCQEDAHWPATCEEAQVFRQKNASYARLVKTEKKKVLITSVQVKHCPFCDYPVEKGMGCNHMTCILCRNQFCWDCLQKWGYPHKCKSRVGLRKIQLPKKFVRVSYEHVAVTSRFARTASLICKIHRKLDKIEEGLNIYAECFPLKPDLKKTSHTEKRLKLLCENKVTNHLKEVFNFKFQAHLVLEGVAISLSFSNDAACSKKLAVEFSRLLFIVERMDEILKDLNHCLVKKESLSKLKSFVRFGKKCILLIGRNTK